MFHMWWIQKQTIPSYDSVHYDRDDKHNVKYDKGFCLLKLLFLVFPLLVLVTQRENIGE